MEGWIKLHRKITQWEWWDDSNTFKVFIYLLLTGNSTDKIWHGLSLKRGQMVTGYLTVSQQTKIPYQTIRTVFRRLKSTGEITVKTTNKYSIVTINNYNSYQLTNSQAHTQSTVNQQATNRQLTTTKNNKNNKNIYNISRKNACPLKEHKSCIEFLDKLAKQKNLPHGWVNFPKQLSFLHKLLKLQYSFDDIEKEALLLDKSNFMWDKWDLATIGAVLEKKGREVIINGAGK